MNDNGDPSVDLKDILNMCMDDCDAESNLFNLLSINSKYYDVDINILQDESDIHFQYKTLHLNIQGLHAKFDDFKFLLLQLNEQNIQLDIIMLCETFLNDNNADLYHIPGYHFVYHNRKNMIKGGVAMYIRDTLNYKLRNDISIFIEGEFECIFVEISDKESTVIGEIYRIPNSSPQLSLERYESILSNINNRFKRVIIGTDQNFD